MDKNDKLIAEVIYWLSGAIGCLARGDLAMGSRMMSWATDDMLKVETKD